MKTCPNCGKECTDQAVFCRHCGKKFTENAEVKPSTTVEVETLKKMMDEGISYLYKDIDSILEGFKKTIRKCEDLSKECASLKEEKASLEKTVNDLKTRENEAEKLKKELDQKEQEIADLKRQIAELQKQVKHDPPENPDDEPPVRYCEHCGAEVLPDATFCLSCGEKIG